MKVWDATTGSLLFTLNQHSAKVWLERFPHGIGLSVDFGKGRRVCGGGRWLVFCSALELDNYVCLKHEPNHLACPGFVVVVSNLHTHTHTHTHTHQSRSIVR